MKRSLIYLVAIVVSLSRCEETVPFTQPIDRQTATAGIRWLLQRDGSCPINYSGCSGQGNSNVCCQSGTTCTVDAANDIACCPTGAVCTGTLGSTTGSNGDNGAYVASTTSGFMFPQSTSASTTTSSASAASITGSTVQGAAYPFVYIPTSFVNAATCSSYYSFCQEEYTSCLASLGGQYGVTVAGAGGGVTVQGNAAVTSASAALSICSSLSKQACYGLQETYCTAFGSASAAASSGTFVTGSNAPSRKSSLSEIMLAVTAGVLGMFL